MSDMREKIIKKKKLLKTYKKLCDALFRLPVDFFFIYLFLRNYFLHKKKLYNLLVAGLIYKQIGNFKDGNRD